MNADFYNLRSSISKCFYEKFSDIFVFLFVALICGTAVSSAAQKNPLAKTVWLIESYGTTEDQQAVKIISKEDNQFPAIRFDATGNSGRIVGCNSISFTYSVKKRNLSIKTKLSTMKACSPELTKQDREISSAFGKSKSFRINGNELEIYYDKGKVMRLKRLVK